MLLGGLYSDNIFFIYRYLGHRSIFSPILAEMSATCVCLTCHTYNLLGWFCLYFFYHISSPLQVDFSSCCVPSVRPSRWLVPSGVLVTGLCARALHVLCSLGQHTGEKSWMRAACKRRLVTESGSNCGLGAAGQSLPGIKR